ncbi:MULTISPECIES: DUF6624 domain-containing protein [unclassified Streptomyces]|uniref:DUF6624 domain-containing protein n=1 Tax=unclassified Streptomyces TaxID=2593676 RepID=UPI000DC7BB17|nr:MULTISPECIES: DUF6624 domain-containing protein [unclassified Streptomyces]AWZ03547.1 hypothetical protein DRB89_01660 [Streptomyces sp. ICC4]AWZ12594.1 hypothetical protein DRB96_09980 [Streptomyces sp. ICC1]
MIPPTTTVTIPLAAVAHQLTEMGRAERRAQLIAWRIPSKHREKELHLVRRTNADGLKKIVAAHGWPTAGLVGDEAAVHAVRILLVCQEPAFLFQCRDMMKPAVESGELPEQFFAHVVDVCAVTMSVPQTYGTQVNPRTLRPYAIKDVEAAERLRADIGLVPLAKQTADYLAHGAGPNAEGQG